MRLLSLAVVTVLLTGFAAPLQAAGDARTSYERVLAKDRDLAARPKAQVSEAELRKVSLSFENIARRFPTSGYADNSLLRAGQVAEELHKRFHRDADIKRAQLLYAWLAKEYPTSPLARQARETAQRLSATPAVPAASSLAPRSALAEARVARPPAPVGNTPEAPAATPTTGSPTALGAGQRLRAVRRSVLPELVRVTLELDGEIAYQQERVDGPPRLFFDLEGVQPAPQLQDAVLTWPDDIVRQVRLGRRSQTTTRVVLDVEGVSRYSVFTLYNPYRVVVDLERGGGPRTTVVAKSTTPTVTRDRVATTPRTPAPAASRPNAAVSKPAPVAPRASVDVDLRPAPRLAVPLSTPPFVPDVPKAAGLTVEAVAATAVATSAEAVRLTPEQPITSREIDLLPTAPGAPAAASVTPAPTAPAVLTTSARVATKAGKPQDLEGPPVSAATPAKKPSPKAVARRQPAPPSPAEPAVPAVADVTTPSAQSPTHAGPAAVPTSVAPAEPTSAATLISALPPVPVPTNTPPLRASAAPSAPEANGNGGFSLARQLGLGISRIVVDPGHGGHDPGAQGKNVSEAELVLDVALRLEKLLQKQAGVEVVLTRRDDTFIPLEERTALANRQQADLFLSIHANASRNVQARGVETYFLNFASNPDAEAVAARENSASARTMHNLPDIVKAIALNTKLDESRDLARMVQGSLVKRLSGQNQQLRDLGVKQAPFVVLIGAAMPSVLAEISFVTHPQEAQLLKSNAYRQKIAEALQDAVLKYQRSLKAVGTVAQQ